MARKAAAKSRRRSAALATTRRPHYVVVFRRPSEANVSPMSSVLGVKEAPGVSSRKSCVVLRAKSAGGPEPLVYRRLGVAVADLTDSQVKTLQSKEAVSVVARNELREIPPLAQRTGYAQDAPTAPQRLAEGGRVLLDPMGAYLEGLRDAAELALSFRGRTSTSGLALVAPLAAANETHSWALDLVGMPAGYSLATGNGVKVAVLDTGVDLQHLDFQQQNLVEGDNAESFVTGESVQDGNGHGTHCCGVVAGPLVSSGGKRYGVAPDVDLIVGKVLGDNGSGWDDWILDGIDWAIDQGAHVISMSLSSSRPLNGDFASAYEVIAENELATNPESLIIAAAGNRSLRPFFTAPVYNPAACPSIMAVAAINRSRQIADFSCREMDSIGEVNVSGPGVDIYSAWTGNGFRLDSGTSMAAPHAAGLAALHREHDPGLSARQLWVRLQQTAVFLGDRSDFGNGLAQAPAG